MLTLISEWSDIMFWMALIGGAIVTLSQFVEFTITYFRKQYLNAGIAFVFWAIGMAAIAVVLAVPLWGLLGPAGYVILIGHHNKRQKEAA